MHFLGIPSLYSQPMRHNILLEGQEVREFWETLCFSDKREKKRLGPHRYFFFLSKYRYATWSWSNHSVTMRNKGQEKSRDANPNWSSYAV